MQRTAPPNVERVLKCVEYCLQRISFDHPTIAFYTDGAVVLRGMDPTAMDADAQLKYCEKGVSFGIMPGQEDTTNQRTGGARRYDWTYPIYCLATIKPEDRVGTGTDKIALTDLQARIVEDIKSALEPNSEGQCPIKAAALALDFPVIVNDLRVSIIAHRVAAVRSDLGSAWPDINFDVLMSFSYDRTL